MLDICMPSGHVPLGIQASFRAFGTSYHGQTSVGGAKGGGGPVCWKLSEGWPPLHYVVAADQHLP